MSNKSTSSTGVSGFFLLGLLFVGLKLTGYISWSWWWVTLPFWGGIALVLAIIVLCFGGAALIALIERK